MEQQNILMPFDMAFRKNQEIRPCSFDASTNFELVQDEYGNLTKLLGLQTKLLWFHTYCAEQGKTGRIECDDYEILQNEAQGTGIVLAKARVIIDNQVVATGCGSAGFSFTSTDQSRSNVLQAASGSALTRALGYAGFGAISSMDIPNGPVPGPVGQPATLPYQIPDTPTVPPVMQPTAPQGYQHTVGNNGAPAGNPMGDQTSLFGNPTPPAVTVSSQEQLMNAAKAEIWPLKGQFQGKTLGELLATSPRQILWAVDGWKPRDPNQQRIQDAAKLLYPEAKNRCGK